MMRRGSGELALVTGGASGIGAASARRLRADGADVLVCDVADEAGTAVADALDATFVHLDVGDPEAWAALVTQVAEQRGRLRRVHLNAGILSAREPAPFLETPVVRLDRVRAVNLDGVVLGVHTLAPLIANGGGGAIVATASLAGLGPYADDPMYAATKHAVVGFVRSVFPELARRGVRLHAICPGGVDTGLLDGHRKELALASGRPMLDPDEVAAEVMVLLASDEAGLVETIVSGRGAERYEFRGVPGPRT
jgi:NAD(P)-dependent dehydrogenase (short-subunit alcohol dehydrogenase family)